MNDDNVIVLIGEQNAEIHADRSEIIAVEDLTSEIPRFAGRTVTRVYFRSGLCFNTRNDADDILEMLGIDWNALHGRDDSTDDAQLDLVEACGEGTPAA